MFIFIMFIAVNCLGCVSFDGNPEINMTVNSKVVEFYANASLFCYVANFSSEYRYLKWTRGLENKLLTFDGSSNDLSKFHEVKNNFGFGLTIINVTEDDVNMEYSCFYDFQQESFNFTVNESYFQLLPTDETTTISTTVQNGTLSIDIEFRKILPKPICFVSFNRKHISLQEKTQTTRNGNFYNVTLHIDIPFLDVDCYSIVLNCSIGTKTMTVYNKEQKNCKDDTGRNDMKTIIVWVIVGFSIVMALVCTAFYKNVAGYIIPTCRSRRNRTEFFRLRRVP